MKLISLKENPECKDRAIRYFQSKEAGGKKFFSIFTSVNGTNKIEVKK